MITGEPQEGVFRSEETDRNVAGQEKFPYSDLDDNDLEVLAAYYKSQKRIAVAEKCPAELERRAQANIDK